MRLTESPSAKRLALPCWTAPNYTARMTLEERVAALEERLGMESGLRASQDRDLASIATNVRAINHSMQALAITQSEHNRKLEDLAAVVDRHTGDLKEIRNEMRAGFAALTTLLTTLIEHGEPGEGA